MSSGSRVPRLYNGFRGVDFRGEEVNLMRSPDSLNMWKDYKETDSIRTRPGLMDVLKNIIGTVRVWGIHFYTINGSENMLIHADSCLLVYDLTKKELKEEHAFTKRLKETPSKSFIYKNIFYFKDGRYYLQYDGETIKEVEGYVPTTSIGRKPKSGGVIHEDVNLLTGKRINTFCADGTAEYHLDSRDIDSVDKVRVNDVDIPKDKYTVDTVLGTITFKEEFEPEAPATDGQDNVSIAFTKTIKGDREKITKCTLLEVFDNRVFFSGNPDFPNYVWHCSLDNPAYCSTLDYYIEGLDTAKVTGLVAGNNALWVLKEPSQSNTSIYYHVPTIDGEYGKIYPSVHSNIALGCVGGATNFNDDIVFFSQRGMEGIHGDITTEQAVAHRSSLVDRKLLSEEVYKDILSKKVYTNVLDKTEEHTQQIITVEWEGYLLCFVGKKVYLADSRARFTNEDHFEYEWFYWELDVDVTCAAVHNGVLYVGTDLVKMGTLLPLPNFSEFIWAGVYSFTDLESAIESYWVTPKDKFGYPHYMKTTNKRGCVVEATGDLSVYAKTEKDKDFTDGTDGTTNTLIKSYTDVGDYCVSRIKRKKFKDIQLKFHSKTRFSLESATLECFIGGYIKR